MSVFSMDPSEAHTLPGYVFVPKLGPFCRWEVLGEAGVLQKLPVLYLWQSIPAVLFKLQPKGIFQHLAGDTGRTVVPKSHPSVLLN